MDSRSRARRGRRPGGWLGCGPRSLGSAATRWCFCPWARSRGLARMPWSARPDVRCRLPRGRGPARARAGRPRGSDGRPGADCRGYGRRGRWSVRPRIPCAGRACGGRSRLGVRAIDGLLTVGEGQRVGLFAGAGVGKSVLLGQIARNTEADVNVICLVGERGREVAGIRRGQPGRRRAAPVRSWCAPPAMRRAWCASSRRSWPPPSPSGSASAASACSC